jgi:hypothetical protein
VHDVLEDPEMAAVLSDEGPVAILSQLIPESPTRLAHLETSLSGSSPHTAASFVGDRHSPAL